MKALELIDTTQRAQVGALTGKYIEQASRIFLRHFVMLPVFFDLSGRLAGMYKVHGRTRCIRYNPWLFARYYEENLAVTVPHEVSHYLTDTIHGRRGIRPHGKEWREIMALFGADDQVIADFDLSGIPGRSYQTEDYRCACRSHRLTHIRHNRIRRGWRYYCKSCNTELRR